MSTSKKQLKAKSIPPHGTTARYTNVRHPCRCVACSEAHKKYRREMDARKKSERERIRAETFAGLSLPREMTRIQSTMPNVDI
jgi:hypothetical protein